MAVVPILSDEAAGAEALAVFDDIRAKRNTDYVNNFWRALAADPALLRAGRFEASFAQSDQDFQRIPLLGRPPMLGRGLSCAGADGELRQPAGGGTHGQQ